MLQQLSYNSRRLCPFLQEPFDDCYCIKMNSQNIEKTIYYCSKNFETCEIYKNGNSNNNHEEEEIRSVRASL